MPYKNIKCIFSKDFSCIFNYVYMCMSEFGLGHVSALSSKAKESTGSLGARVRGNCRWPDMDAES